MIGDEAFALTEYLMKVYPEFHPKGSKERIYNYRITTIGFAEHAELLKTFSV